MVRQIDFKFEHLHAISSGLISDDSAVICNHPCWYLGTTVVQGINLNLTTYFTVYDNATEGAGTKIDYFRMSDEEQLNVCHILDEPIWCSNGIYAESTEQMYGSFLIWYAN